MNEAQAATRVDFVNALGNAVRENPLPAALIGMGLVWLFTGARSPNAGFGAVAGGLSKVGAQVNEGARSFGQTISSTVGSAGDSVREESAAASRAASDAALSLTDTAREFASAAPAVSSQLFSTARSNLSDLMQRQPLLLGAIGLAIGAGVAAAVQATPAEKELLGRASGDFQRDARDFAADQTRRATSVAAGVATAVAQEARVQGLTPGGIKGKANEIGQKMKNVFDQGFGDSRDRLT